MYLAVRWERHRPNPLLVQLASQSKSKVQPSTQTNLIIDIMTRRSDEENTKWENLQKNLDVMFHQITEMYSVQKQMKAQLDLTAAAMDEYTHEQHLISQ